MQTLGSARRSALLLLVGMVVTLPLATHLDFHWGWENGPIENLQALILWAGAMAACGAAWQQRSSAVGGAIWRVAAIIWLGMLGRELAWGATFLPAIGFDAHSGPVYSSHSVWWRPAVGWVCGALLLLSAYWVVRDRLLSRVVLRWWREGAWPWSCLLVFVLGMVVSAQAEGHGHIPWLSAHITGLVAEEMAEAWAYAALWCAQWHLIRHTARWAQPGLRAAAANATLDGHWKGGAV